jgi:hypothetical protein
MTIGTNVKRARGVVVLVIGVVLIAGVVGCTSAAQEPPGLTATPTVSLTPTPEPTEDTAVVEAAILDVYYRYWAATVAAQRGDPDPTLFADNTRGLLVEEELATARQYVDLGISREGEPEISNVVVEADDEAADVWACVDNSTWVVPEAQGESVGVLPTGLHLELVEGAWFVTDYITPPVDFAC